MANLKLSQLTQTTPNGTEYIEVIISPFTPGTNRKVLLQDLIDIISPPGGGVTSVNGDTGPVVSLIASEIPNTPAGTIAATDVQAAVTELDGDIQGHITDTAAAHAASAIAFTPVGTIAATDVQAAIAEVAAEAGGGTIASQATVNAGTNDTEIISPLKAAKLNRDAIALTDTSTIDLTGAKHTLASSSGTRTFTISHIGEFITIEVTLSTTTATYTFPAAALCTSEGSASGNNTLALSGVSGDKYLIISQSIGSNYYIVAKNFGQ